MKNNENAKNENWITPMKLHGVKPEDYDVSIKSANGSANVSKEESPTNKTSADLPKYEQKKQGKFPLHDEKIGGG